MAFETFGLELQGERYGLAHMPRVIGGEHGLSVIASVGGLDRSLGMVLTVGDVGYGKTEWEKMTYPNRRLQLGIASPVVKVDFVREQEEDRPEQTLNDYDLELFARLRKAGEGTLWLAAYGYREEYGSSEVVDLPVHQAKLYVGDESGSIPAELENLFEDDPIFGYPLRAGRRISLKPYPAIGRHDGYDHPAFYTALKEILPLSPIPREPRAGIAA